MLAYSIGACCRNTLANTDSCPPRGYNSDSMWATQELDGHLHNVVPVMARGLWHNRARVGIVQVRTRQGHLKPGTRRS